MSNIVDYTHLARLLDKCRHLFATKKEMKECLQYDENFVEGDTIYLDGRVEGDTLYLNSGKVVDGVLYFNND